MIKYEIRLKRIGDYRFLFDILTHYHAKPISHDERKSKVSLIISKSHISEFEKSLKESGLEYRILE